MRPVACADFTFPLLSHDRVLDLIALLEFDAVDIGLFEGRSHLQPSQVLYQPVESARTLVEKLEQRGLALADVFLQAAPDFASLAVNQPDATRRHEARKIFLRTLEFAREGGSRHVSGLPGVLFEEESTESSWERAIDELAWRCEAATEYGLTFAVEAHVGSLAPTPADALRLVKSVPGLTLTLDYTHFTRLGMSDRSVEPLVPYASHIHVRGAREGRLQCSFKDNTIDYRRVLKLLANSQYSGYLGVEYVWIDWEHCNEVDNVSESILWRDFLRASTSNAR